jgi:hypothetical protein
MNDIRVEIIIFSVFHQFHFNYGDLDLPFDTVEQIWSKVFATLKFYSANPEKAVQKYSKFSCSFLTSYCTQYQQANEQTFTFCFNFFKNILDLRVFVIIHQVSFLIDSFLSLSPQNIYLCFEYGFVQYLTSNLQLFFQKKHFKNVLDTFSIIFSALHQCSTSSLLTLFIQQISALNVEAFFSKFINSLRNPENREHICESLTSFFIILANFVFWTKINIFKIPFHQCSKIGSFVFSNCSSNTKFSCSFFLLSQILVSDPLEILPVLNETFFVQIIENFQSEEYQESRANIYVELSEKFQTFENFHHYLSLINENLSI